MNYFIIAAIVLVEATYSSIIFEDESFFSGSPCIEKSKNTTGICKPIHDCPELVQKLKTKSTWNTTVCGFEGNEQIICCPSSETKVEIEKLNILEITETPEITSFNELILNFTSQNDDKNFNCYDRVNKFEGVKKFRKHCPELSDLKPNSEVYCDNDLCRDIVCCPVNPNRLAYR